MARIARRQFLKGLGAAAGAGCHPRSGDSGPGSIDTIVIAMMENRSFNHMFGALSLEEGRAVDGLLASHYNPMSDGTPVAPYRLTRPCLEPDPPHSWSRSHQQLDGGTNLGFVKACAEAYPDADPTVVMSYLTREDVPISYALADRYTLCQRWYSSVLTSTWPNRLYSHGAQSQGMTSNDFPDTTFFTMKTIWDQLDEAGIEWAYYYSDLPMLALFGRFSERVKLLEHFFADASAGRLPPVVMVEPAAGLNDDHPPHHHLLGQLFLASIHNALAASPQWDRSMFVVTYDEAGGFFDHVPPPTAPDDRADEGFDQLGFRVPSLIMGPYARQGHVCDTPFDHTSPLAHIQRLYGLEPLTARDAAANDLWSAIDTDRLDRNDPAEPADLPVIELSEEQILAQCDATEAMGTGQPELQAFLARAGLEHLDRTRDLPRLGRELLERASDLGACVVR